MANFIIVLLAGCNLMDPQIVRFDRAIGVDPTDTGDTAIDTGETGGETGDSDSSDTGDTGETGETGDTADSADSGDSGDTADSGDTGDTSDTADTSDTGTIDTSDTGVVDTSDTSVPVDTSDTGVVDTGADTGVVDTSTPLDTADTGVVDTGVPVDTSTVDTSTPIDTSVPVDTGVPVDTSMVDTGGDTSVVVLPVDSDGDGYAADVDCDDADVTVNPAATETCNGVDDDCDGAIDERGAAGETSWYADGDGDGYGDALGAFISCDMPIGYVADATDCDDADVTVNPAATETCNGVDDDCSGSIDDGAVVWSDWYADNDGDGYGDAATSVVDCSEPSGYVADATDCDDAHTEVNPAQAESMYTVWDDDCDGTTYTGLTLAYGVAATSDSYIVDDIESTFDGGISGNWDVISNVLGLTAADMVVSSGTWSNTLVGTYDGLEFFGTGGAGSQDDECRVYVGPLETEAGLTVHSGDRLAVVFNIDNDAAARNGIGVYLGDAWDTTTWSPLLALLPINPSTDEFEVATGNATMDDPNVIICAGGIATSGMVRFTHVAVVTY